MRVLWAILGVIVVLGATVTLLDYNNLNSETQQTEVKESSVTSIQITLEPQTSKLSSSEILVNPTTQTTNQFIGGQFILPLSKAYGITSSQLSLSTSTWDLGRQISHDAGINVDSNNDVWIAARNNFVKLEPDTNTFTEWTFPTFSEPALKNVNPSTPSLIYGTVNGAFNQGENASNILAELDVSQNKFRHWILADQNPDANIGKVFPDNSGKVYFTTWERISSSQWKILLNQFDPSNDTLKQWEITTLLGTNSNIDQINADSSTVYFILNRSSSDNSALGKLELSTNTFTIWTLSSGIALYDLKIDSGILYYSGLKESTPSEFDLETVGKFDPSTNSAKEWEITGDGGNLDIDVDSFDNIYLSLGNKMARINTSTDAITIWDLRVRELAIDSTDSVLVLLNQNNNQDIGKLS
jgi:streptogramin lyase